MKFEVASASMGGKSEQKGDTNVGSDQAEVTPANFATYIQQQREAAASTKSASQLFPFCETGSSLSPKLDMPKLENWIAPFCETKSSLSAKLFIQIEITNTTTAHKVEPVAMQDGWSKRSNFENATTSNTVATSPVFPESLDKRHHASAIKVISRAPRPLQQSILDELDAALQSGKTICNIAGWLNSVAEKANDGTLIFSLADGIAEIRKRREHQVERGRTLLKTTHTATQDTNGGIAVETPVVNSDAVKTAREMLRLMGAEMRNKNIGISK